MKYLSKKLIILSLSSMLIISGCSQKTSAPSFQSPDKEQVVVESADGLVQLDLEGVNLPEGLSIGDISIAPIPTDTEEGLQAGVAYDLLPEGVVFEEPVTLTLSLPTSDDALIPFVMHSTPDSTEVVDNVVVINNMDDNSLTLEVPVTHFSKIWTTNHGFKATTLGGGEYPVGGSTPLKITVTPSGSDMGIRNNDRKRYYGADFKKGTTYTIKDLTFLNSGFGKQPLRIDAKSIPGKKDLALDAGATFYNSFFCESEGIGTVSTNIGLEYTIEYYPDRGYANVSPKLREAKGGTSFTLRNTYTCVEGMMIQITPYTIICPNGEGRSGAYLSDPSTGELITNAAGEKLDSITGQPIPPCPKMR